MATRLEAARLLTWKAACLRDNGQSFTKVIYNSNTIVIFLSVHN